MSGAGDILQRVRELAVQSANATNSAERPPGPASRKSTQLVSELDRIAQTTEFNGQSCSTAPLARQQFQVGANANQTIVATTANLRTNVSTATTKCRLGWRLPRLAAPRLWTPTGGGGTMAINGTLGSTNITVVANDTAKTTADEINLQTADARASPPPRAPKSS